MKKSILFLLLIALLLSSCQGRTVEQPGASTVEPSSISEVPAPSVSEPQTKESAISESNETTDTENSATDMPVEPIEVTLENLFPTLPENVTIEGNALYDTENAIVMAELTSVESIENLSDPFSHYDQIYAEAVRIEEGTWGENSGKWYWLKKEIEGSAVGGFENHIVYCIQAGESMIVITFHPVQGVGGIGSQREAFEEILSTIHLGG